MSALDTQVGGSHYKDLKIQPMQYSMANKLDACQHTIIKYVTRFRAKGGIADLEKARHCIDMLIEFEKAGVDPEWPADEQRIDAIGQNGNDGEHYNINQMIEWTGNKCPVKLSTKVDVITRGGAAFSGKASEFSWNYQGNNVDVVAYRVIE